MSKTEETKELEKIIWNATSKTGVFGCFEVTIGWWGEERVDYMTYDTKGIWRCYEIKVSKEDFYSKAKKTFVGHYNYFVLPNIELYEEVKSDIPIHIGIYVGSSNVKKARKQNLKVDEQILKDSMIRSLYRDVEKLFKSENPKVIESYNRKIDRLTKEKYNLQKQNAKLMSMLYNKFRHEWRNLIDV